MDGGGEKKGMFLALPSAKRGKGEGRVRWRALVSAPAVSVYIFTPHFAAPCVVGSMIKG